ncbi:hypothetical protein Enr10x_06290 [Gimesia panareensis]|uniref:Uncharacterized protein n=1 Tax=Gimesia panareensis TaxID=2527978 RepID=A0A517Q126_9PLAN|nr:hypothetical protein Enr10x_06290 [Gimesia panareensis]QDU48289.1 hypothetical protein Pan110_06020 [Gimesia panareensis]
MQYVLLQINFAKILWTIRKDFGICPSFLCIFQQREADVIDCDEGIQRT